MKILIVGAWGTMGAYLIRVLEQENHEIIKPNCSSGDVRVDITSTQSIEEMFNKVGGFDALISSVDPTFVGSWKNLNDQAFRTGIEGKMMGQINLVLIGQKYIQSKGSFTLITGALIHEPQRNFANAYAVNGAVEGLVRATAIELDNGIRINAVSPTVIESSPQYFPYFPGETPITMKQLEFGFGKAFLGQ